MLKNLNYKTFRRMRMKKMKHQRRYNGFILPRMVIKFSIQLTFSINVFSSSIVVICGGVN